MITPKLLICCLLFCCNALVVPLDASENSRSYEDDSRDYPYQARISFCPSKLNNNDLAVIIEGKVTATDELGESSEIIIQPVRVGEEKKTISTINNSSQKFIFLIARERSMFSDRQERQPNETKVAKFLRYHK